MFYNRVALKFSDMYEKSLFTDLEVNVTLGVESKIFYVHKVIMSAASAHFFKELVENDEVGKAVDRITIQMKPQSFEAYLHLVYDGYAVIESDDIEDFQLALQYLEPVCLPDPDDQAQAASTSKKSRKKPKLENGDEVEVKPDLKTFMDLSLDNLPEEKISKLIIAGEGQKDFTCCICNKKFQQRRSAFDHIMVDHRSIRDYKCDYCGQGFGTSNRRSNHISKAHSAMHKVRKALEQVSRDWKLE